MRNYLLIVNGKAIKDYMSLCRACNAYKSYVKRGFLVALVDLRSGWTLDSNYD